MLFLTPPPKPQVQQADALRVPVPPETPKGFAEQEDTAAPAGKVRTLWTFRRNNPRSTYLLATAPKRLPGRPALVDAAGKPVRQNLAFTVANPSLGKIRVYATKLARGPFYTAWTPLPKNSAGRYLRVSGSGMSASEIRALVAGVRLLKTSRPPQKTVGGDPFERDADEGTTTGGTTGGGSR